MNVNEYRKAPVALRLLFIVLSCEGIHGVYLYYNYFIDGNSARIICESNGGILPAVGLKDLLKERHWVDNKICNIISECAVGVNGVCMPRPCNETEKLFCQVDSRCLSKNKSSQQVSEIKSVIQKGESCEEKCCQMKLCRGISYENDNCIMYKSGAATVKDIFTKENIIETMTFKESVIAETASLCATDFWESEIPSIETPVAVTVQPTSTVKLSITIFNTEKPDSLSTVAFSDSGQSYISPTSTYTMGSSSMVFPVSVEETTNTVSVSPLVQPTERSLDLSTFLSPSFSSQCFCRCQGPTTSLSEEESKSKMSQLREELTIPKKDLSSTYRKKTSMPDDRVSAKSIGLVGVGIMCVVFGGIVILDLGVMASHLKILYKNVFERYRS